MGISEEKVCVFSITMYIGRESTHIVPASTGIIEGLCKALSIRLLQSVFVNFMLPGGGL